MYESEHTKFMRELMARKPHLADEQKKGRAIWWDKTPDAEADEANSSARVPQQAYPYQTKG
jgi:hypothetical protein